MAEPAKEMSSRTDSRNRSTLTSTTSDQIKNRRSQELVIGVCGAIGCGMPDLVSTLKSQLTSDGYEVELVKLSKLIIDNQLNPQDGKDYSDLAGAQRYNTLQDLGDDLRREYCLEHIAKLATQHIHTYRDYVHGSDNTPAEPTKITQKVAYIIDQIKHPAEIKLLREVYKNNFYLIGFLRTEEDRKMTLKNEQISDLDISKLVERDKKGQNSDDYGQLVSKCLHLSDYFIRNTNDSRARNDSVDRFIKLTHGASHITPTKDEVGIYAAHAASLNSACLSRQVGASILDEDGNILSTGCNDVPKFGGGLYTSNASKDSRCHNHEGLCHNDKHKKQLREEIKDILRKANVSDPDGLAKSIMGNTKAKSLIEYSRAVHAEMDAITSIARTTNSSTVDKTLYCTTYPCHVCARHIVAAGIKRVVYIEPYEKSLALDLHNDSISQSDTNASNEKMMMENFEGVAPFRYQKFFGYNKAKKDSDGKLIEYTVLDSGHVDPQYLDSYHDYELKVIESIEKATASPHPL